MCVCYWQITEVGISMKRIRSISVLVLAALLALALVPTFAFASPKKADSADTALTAVSDTSTQSGVKDEAGDATVTTAPDAVLAPLSDSTDEASAKDGTGASLAPLSSEDTGDATSPDAAAPDASASIDPLSSDDQGASLAPLSYDGDFFVIDDPNGNFLTDLQAMLDAAPFNQGGTYDYSVVKKLKITGNMTDADFTDMASVIGLYVEEIDISGITNTSYPDMVFSGYTALTKIRIPADAPMGNSMFWQDTSLKTLVCGDGPFTDGVIDLSAYTPSYADGHVFVGSAIETVRLPVTYELGEYDFGWCADLKTMVVGDGPFTDGVIDLSNYSASDTLASLLFNGAGIEKLVLADALKIGVFTLNVCSNLEWIRFMGPEAPSISTNAFLDTNPPIAYVPNKDTGGYESTDFSQYFSEVRNWIYPVTSGFGTFTGTGTLDAMIPTASDTSFLSLLSGGKEVDPANYIVSTDGTTITLTEDYLNTLSNGTYSFVAVYVAGTSEQISLEVDNQTVPVPETVAPTSPAAPVSPTSTVLPATGDASLYLWLSSLAMILASLSVLFLRARKVKAPAHFRR